MPHFFIKLIPPRPTFVMDMNDDEKKLMQTHFQYWQQRQDGGDLPVFGPVFDPKGAFGMGVMESADESAAAAFASSDPAMKAGVGFKVEIYPMRAVMREQPKS